MEIEREGLHTYEIASSVENKYFLSVEYQTIRYNHPDTLLPMLIREQDGVTKLLYDISEAKSLAVLSQANNSHGNNFSKEDCRCLLKNMQQLLKDLEDLMLSPAHINFSPEGTYRTGKGTFRWMYCPDKEFDMGKEVQQFFSWMLSEINYGDSEAVRYIYHVYWLMRNRNFSEKLIGECLDYKEEPPKITSYESFFAQEIAREDFDAESGTTVKKSQAENPAKGVMGEAVERTAGKVVGRTGGKMVGETGRKMAGGAAGEVIRKEKKMSGRKSAEIKEGRRKGMLAAEVLLVAAAAGTGVTAAASGIYMFWNGMAPLSSRYWIGCVILLVILAEGAFQMHRRRKNQTKNVGAGSADGTGGVYKAGGADSVYGADGVYGAGSADRSDIEMESFSPKFRFPGGGDEGTVRLDAGVRKKRPVLKNEESGELFPLQSFPYYIGNDKGLNQLTIYDQTVSRKHALIDRGPIPGTYVLRDLQSTNGTWVNHIRMGEEAVELREGDVIRFAAHSYVFEIPEDFAIMV